MLMLFVIIKLLKVGAVEYSIINILMEIVCGSCALSLCIL